MVGDKGTQDGQGSCPPRAYCLCRDTDHPIGEGWGRKSTGAFLHVEHHAVRAMRSFFTPQQSRHFGKREIRENKTVGRADGKAGGG